MVLMIYLYKLKHQKFWLFYENSKSMTLTRRLPPGGDGADKSSRPISTIRPNMNEIHQRVFKIWGLINFNAKTLTLCPRTWRKDERTNKQKKTIYPHIQIKIHESQQTHNVATTALQHHCNVMMLQQRYNDVVGTLCVCWDSSKSFQNTYQRKCTCIKSDTWFFNI